MELRAIPRLVVIQVIAVGALTFLFAGDAWSASYKVPYNFNSANAGPYGPPQCVLLEHRAG